MRRLGFAVLAVFAFAATTAEARPLGEWSGFYVGAMGAGAFGSHSASQTGIPAGDSGSKDFALDHGSSGWMAGPQIGYFRQFGGLVWGLEGDVDFGNLGGSKTITGTGITHRDKTGGNAGNFITSRDRTDVMADVRGTVGFAVWRGVLPYLTGGWMYGHTQYSGQLHYASTPAVNFPARDGAGDSGWTVGGGFAWAVTSDAAVKLEYLYYDLGDHRIVSKAQGALRSRFDFSPNGNLVRLGLTYRMP